MTNYRITSPDPTFSGVVANVIFNEGVAYLTADHEVDRVDGATNLPQPIAALAYFRRRRYGIEEVTASVPVQKPELEGTLNSSAVDHPLATGHPAGDGTTPVVSSTPTPVVPAPAPAPEAKLPAKSASKADWKAYAVNHGGMSEADAEDATRDQLAEKYTEAAQ
ncbi:MAG TPA: hypothetical protein VNO31_35515 [Umezawaea sp.]|nr:hypothetical protein [Umezawaea sp.]